MFVEIWNVQALNGQKLSKPAGNVQKTIKYPEKKVNLNLVDESLNVNRMV